MDIKNIIYLHFIKEHLALEYNSIAHFSEVNEDRYICRQYA